MLAQRNSRLARNKLAHVKKVTEQRMVECLPAPRFKEDYSHHLASIYATCEDLEDYSIDEETGALERSDEDNLFKDLRDNCDMSIDGNKDAIIHLKNKVLENVKVHVKKCRTRRDSSVGSVSSITSTSSNKRKALLDQKESESKSIKISDTKVSALPKPIQ